MKNILLFDLDDTLIETYSTGYNRVCYSFSQLGLLPITLDEFKGVYGKVPFPFCFESWVGQKRMDAFLYHYEKGKEHFPYASIVPLQEFVNHIHGMGLKLGIVTNTPVDRLQQKLEAVKSTVDHFDFIYCQANKPDPTGLLKAIDFFKVDPEQAIYFGDAITDYMAAESAKIDFAGVLTGTTEAKEFNSNGLGYDRIFPSVVCLQNVGILRRITNSLSLLRKKVL